MPLDVKGKGKATCESEEEGEAEDEAMAEAKDDDSDADYTPSNHFKKEPDSDSDKDTKPPKTSPPPESGVRLLKNDFQSSTKLEALKESLLAARELDSGLKAVVFTQFTGFLDLIERLMNRERFR